MTANGPMTKIFDFTHMYDFVNPNRNCCVFLKYRNSSLYGHIQNNPNLSIFKFIVDKAQLGTILDDMQAEFTLFVPTDEELMKRFSQNVFVNMDKGEAYALIKSSLLERRLPSEIIQNSPAAYFTTKYPPNKLFITNINGKTTLNKTVDVIKKDIMCDNGIIHYTNNLVNTELELQGN